MQQNKYSCGYPLIFKMRSILIITLTSLTIITFGQESNSKIDARDLKKFVKILSSDSLEGRGTGTEGQRKAEKFISDRFTELGLNTSIEKFKLKQIHWGQVYLKTKSNTLYNFENMVLQGSNRQNSEVELEVVFGGLGTKKELDQIEVKDKLVLVFVNNLRSSYDINISVGKRNAYGLIIANPQSEKQFESIKNTFKDYSLQKRTIPFNTDSTNSLKTQFSKMFDTLKFVNTIVIPNSQIKNISGLSLRSLQKLIKDGKINEAPIYKVKAKFEWIENEIESSNVIGTIKGKRDKTIIVSAHYDHLGKIENKYFPGADDNASGTAALLELAEEFIDSNNLNYNITFIATSGEENGLLGSSYHVNSSNFKPSDILWNLNIDMISRTDDRHSKSNYIYCIGTAQSKQIENVLKTADELYRECYFDYSLNMTDFPTGLFSRSDNYNFYKKGIVSIQFFSGLHADYHKQTDTFDKIDYKNLEKRIRLISTVIELLQKDQVN